MFASVNIQACCSFIVTKLWPKTCFQLYASYSQNQFTVYKKAAYVSENVKCKVNLKKCGMLSIIDCVGIPCKISYVCRGYTNHPDIWLMRGGEVGITDGMGKGNPES